MGDGGGGGGWRCLSLAWGGAGPTRLRWDPRRGGPNQLPSTLNRLDGSVLGSVPPYAVKPEPLLSGWAIVAVRRPPPVPPEGWKRGPVRVRGERGLLHAACDCPRRIRITHSN